MPIVPDTKNWTWVVDRRCAECGFDASAVDAANAVTGVAGRLRRNAVAWPAVLQRPDVRERPDDSTWSALEYAAHVRDVCRLYRERLALMLERDDPVYPNWDQDVAAIEGRYAEQDPATVAAELTDAASALADAFDAVRGEQWQRRGRRSDGASFTVDTFSRYFLHDVVHHLWDVRG
jgi:hypothetical protein